MVDTGLVDQLPFAQRCYLGETLSHPCDLEIPSLLPQLALCHMKVIFNHVLSFFLHGVLG